MASYSNSGLIYGYTSEQWRLLSVEMKNAVRSWVYSVRKNQDDFRDTTATEYKLWEQYKLDNSTALTIDLLYGSNSDFNYVLQIGTTNQKDAGIIPVPQPKETKYTALPKNLIKTNNSYSGCDITASITIGGDTFVIGNLSGISYSVHRDKIPVRTLGRTYAKSYVSGCFEENQIIYTNKGPKKIKDINLGDMILSYNFDTKKSEYQKCINKFDNGIKETIEITLMDGSQQILTAEHKVYTTNGWKLVKELTIDDKLIVNSNYEYDCEDYNVPDYYLILLAYGIGDGVFGSYKNDKETRFSLTPGCYDNDIIKEIEDILETNKIIYRKFFRNNCYNITLRNCKNKGDISTREYYDFIEWTKSLNIYGLYSHNKFIPTEITLSNRQICLFLNRLFGTDGCITTKGNNISISYCSTSKKLIYQIKSLLKRINIHCFIRLNKLNNKITYINNKPIQSRHESYNLTILTEHNEHFVKMIGIKGKENKYKDFNFKNFYKLPINELKSFIKLKGFKQEQLKNPWLNSYSYISYSTIVNNFNLDFAEEYFNKVGKIETFNIHNTKIRNIRLLNKSNVYDLEIDNNHNLFGEFLSHNSATIAGTLIFTVFDTHVLNDVRRKIVSEIQAVGATSSPLTQQLPPFDVTVFFENEYGHQSYMRIYGIEISDEGQTHTINDIYTENQMQYVARDIDLMVAVDDKSTPQSLTFNNNTTKSLSVQLANEGYILQRLTEYNTHLGKIEQEIINGQLKLDQIQTYINNTPKDQTVEINRLNSELVKTNVYLANNKSIKESLTAKISKLDNKSYQDSLVNLGSTYSDGRDSPYNYTRKNSPNISNIDIQEKSLMIDDFKKEDYQNS